MPLLARIGHPRYAQAFADHLKSLGVDVAVHPTPEGVEIKLQDPSQMDAASAPSDVAPAAVRRQSLRQSLNR